MSNFAPNGTLDSIQYLANLDFLSNCLPSIILLHNFMT